LHANKKSKPEQDVNVQADEIQESSGSINDIYTQVEEMPEFPGGFSSIRKFLAENLQYPEKAKEEGIEGKVFVSFIVSDKGKVTDVKIERGVNEELDTEALRIVKLLPDWSPGVENGKQVNVKFTIPIVFALGNLDKEVFFIVEEMPEFDGGIDGMRDYIRKNIMYPAEARDANITGKALVNFVVDKTGKVTQVKIKKGTGNKLLDKEAIRVVESMPDWKPGSQRGQKVNVQFAIPIEFMMTDKGGAIVVDKPGN
jgi:TonB family protein